MYRLLPTVPPTDCTVSYRQYCPYWRIIFWASEACCTASYSRRLYLWLSLGFVLCLSNRSTPLNVPPPTDSTAPYRQYRPVPTMIILTLKKYIYLLLLHTGITYWFRESQSDFNLALFCILFSTFLVPLWLHATPLLPVYWIKWNARRINWTKKRINIERVKW
jgi:hypothetical protein